MDRLDGERIVVTGASAGLGRQMALRYSDEGARVALSSRSEDDLAAVAAEAAGETLVLPTDVTDPEQVASTVDAVVDAWDGVDTLVNNAGIGLLSLYGEGRPLHEIDAEDWRRIIDVNLHGVFHCTKAVVPHMLDAGRGNLINISSGLGRYAAPGYAPYNTSKHGLEGLNKTLALDYEDTGINSNCLDPGGRVATGFWDHLPADEQAEILPADVMNEAAVLLAEQGPDGVSGESMPAEEWEARLG
ncbi:SDR family NAD(P)-dependent oxidoreductase [Haloglomus litoreum]|uniref:SDR family NAD(P)-dependent oxidoreductase n=1 Tax=Haloglomus litoreum TaxID=3034026 RepID=UPI0023E7EC87|nr:SDR family oxidoreductase [Haloglomus sp. DT116]